jgi:PHD/YefM family antitoxin component YafN of YafNO toxin-antitoxin module
MKFVTVSELRLRATQIVSEIEKTREEVVVTKMGKPVVLLRAVEEEEFELKSMKGGKSNGKG